MPPWPPPRRAQVITNFNNFALTQKYDAWTFPPPYTTITSAPTYYETASSRGYGSGYYDIYDSAQGPAISIGDSNELQLQVTVNSGTASFLVDLDDGEGDFWQWSFGYGFGPGTYILDEPLAAPFAKEIVASPPTPGGFDFTQITGFNIELDPGTTNGVNNTYDVDWLSISGVDIPNPNITWDDAGTGGTTGTPGDGVTWDVAVNQNWDMGGGPTYYIDGSNVTFNDNNNASYNVTLNSTVDPNSVTFSNSMGNYTISGSGSISGTGSLTVNGTATVTLDTVNTYTGGTIVSSGTLVAPISGALPNGGSLLNNGTTDIYGNETLGAAGVSALTGTGTLNIGNGTANTVKLAIGSGAASQGSLTIAANSALDIGNNHIILSDAGGGIDATIRAYLAAGYNGGSWNGHSAASGVIVTSAPIIIGSGTYSIGYADGADNVVAGLPSGELEVAYTLAGDANLDGKVDSADFGILADNYGASGAVWDEGDFNYDGKVDSADFGILAVNYGQSAGSNADVVTAADWSALDAFAAANGVTLSEVPEPASAGLLVLACLGSLARRKRHNSVG